MPYIGNITQDFNVSNAMLDTDSVTSIKIVDGTIEGADIAANLDLSDSQKIRFGASNDLQIYHNSNHSFIADTGTGDIRIGADTNITLENSAFNEYKAKFITDGAVELYHNNSKKFETTSAGAKVLGDFLFRNTSDATQMFFDASESKLQVYDNSKITFGNTDDLEIYHSSSNAASYIQNSTGNLFIEAPASAAVKLRKKGTTETMIVAAADGEVELYYDDSKKFNTRVNGIQVQGRIIFDSDTNTYIEHGSGGDEIQLVTGSNTRLLVDGHVKNPNDNSYIFVGASNDLGLVHDGSNSIIKNATNSLFINSAAHIYLANADNSEYKAKFHNNSSVQLYFDNALKFETTSTGVKAYGDFLPNTGDTHDLGSNGAKWSELHLKHYLYMPDAGRIRLGSSYDMQLFYDGTDQVLLGKTGTTYVTCPSGQSVRLNKSSADNFNAESMLRAFADGAVELYHDNSKKFETTSAGILTTGTLVTNLDGGTAGKGQLAFGASGRPFIEGFDSGNHGSGATMNFRTGAGDYMSIMKFDGAVELYYDNAKKLETTSNGVDVTGNFKATSGGTEVQIQPADGLINFGMDGRSSFVTGTNACYIFSGSGSSGDMPAGDLIIQSRSNVNRTIRFVTGSSPAQRASIDSGGLKFGTDSADANALDDYEEGTWTPADASGGGISVSASNNRFTKIGRMVFASGRMAFGSSGNGNTAKITLPFTPDSNIISSAVGSACFEQSYDGNNTVMACINDTGGVIFRKNGSGNLKNDQVSGTVLRFCVYYMTAT